MSAVQRVIYLRAADLAAERPPDAGEDVHFHSGLVELVISEFSRPGDVVLDPFAGYGTTLLVAERLSRHAVGVELLEDRVELIRRRLDGRGRVMRGDARRLAELINEPIDLCFTSPPYMNAVDHPQNPLSGYQSQDGDYSRYLGELGSVFRAVAGLLKPGGHLVVNAATTLTNGVLTPLAWDLARVASEHVVPTGESILVWDEAPPWMSVDYLIVFEKR